MSTSPRPGPVGTSDGAGLRTGRVQPRLDVPPPRLHVAARLEDRFDTALAALLRRRGWTLRIVGYTGYGTGGRVRVLARTLLAAPTVGQDDLPGQDDTSREQPAVRGFRSFFTASVAGAQVLAHVGGRVHTLTTDRGGYLDALVEADLPPGWHEITLTSIDGARATAPVLVLGPDPVDGIVSDIDDTVMVTRLPRPLVAAWNVFVRHENAREPVPGMAGLYRALGGDDPACPVVYLSTGAWNAAPAIARFLRRHDLPVGPLLLTDWGPTNTGWFRSGPTHKVTQLRRLFTDLPQVRWTLVGDDGQHDPVIYAGAVEHHPEHVRAVLVRRLTPGEHVLSHGAPARPAGTGEAEDDTARGGVPVLEGADGVELLRAARTHGLLTAQA